LDVGRFVRKYLFSIKLLSIFFRGIFHGNKSKAGAIARGIMKKLAVLAKINYISEYFRENIKTKVIENFIFL
jgi:hypothetical protein